MLQERINALAADYSGECIHIRHHLHANPELSYNEFETSKFIQQKLTDWGISFRVMAVTGVVGIIKGKNPDKRTLALRADMDALPITEENNVSYKSKNPGVMHACGHDVHTTCLLGAARILQETRNEWEGTIKLIFQPGEEKNPGGASIMIKEGVLQDPAPQGIIALHVHPGLDVGKLSFRSGTVMASADELYISIKAKGGHAAAPQFTADPILIASHLVIALQQIVSRNNDPFNPTVLSITSFQGGSATNIIPREVQLMGTLRCMNENWRKQAHALITKHTQQLCVAMGAESTIHIDMGYPTVVNDVQLTATARHLAESYMGAINVEETEMRMGAEDFGYYAQQIPGCFFRLGVRNEALGIVNNVHTPVFNVDESAIEKGIGIMAWLGATLEVF